jgi:hypothetical protein
VNQFIHVTYFLVAFTSLVTYFVALSDLHNSPPQERLAYHGLMRTALSRVGVGAMYTAIGAALVWWPGSPMWLTLAGYILAAVVWMTNSRLDVHLKSHLDQKETP